jgi:hypothetical protein
MKFSKVRWKREVGRTAVLRAYTKQRLPGGVFHAYEIADRVVTTLGAGFPTQRLLCLPGTKNMSGTDDEIVRRSVRSACALTRSPLNDTRCRACQRRAYNTDGGDEVERLCSHCKALCTCAEERVDGDECCYCYADLLPQHAFFRGFGGPSKAPGRN